MSRFTRRWKCTECGRKYKTRRTRCKFCGGEEFEEPYIRSWGGSNALPRLLG